MSVHDRQLVTGVWYQIQCDTCGALLEQDFSGVWSAPIRSVALAHLADVGWTDHGSDGEQVFCDLCERQH